MITFDRLFIHPGYNTRTLRDRARLIVGLALVIMGLFVIYNLQTALRGGVSLFENALTQGEPFSLIFLIGVYGGGIVTLVASRNGWTTISQIAPLVMWTAGGVMLSVRDGFTATSDVAALFVLIVVGFITMRERGILIALIVGFILFVFGLDRRTLVAPEETGGSLTALIDVSLLLIGTAVGLWLFLRNQSYERLETLAEAESDRLRLATVTTEIARRIASQTALDDLLTSTVEEIRSRYAEIYHAQIFLIDEFGVNARLVASTGDVGALLLSRGHQLEVGSVSVIGQVTETGSPVIARAGSGDTVHRRNELLPETLVEAAFPLLAGGKVIGALDLQSRDGKAFTDEDLPIFQSLADNTAVAIENARLFQQTQTRLAENQRLLDQMGGAMREIERLNLQLTGQSWSEYLGDYVKTPSLDVNFRTNTVERNADWTPTLRQALANDNTVQERRGDSSVIAVPIRVRGQVIGAMEFELDDMTPGQESVGLAQTVGERFGLALENTRLYEETQRVATREQRVNAIAAQYQDVTTVDELLRITISELGGLLGAEKASIRLGGVGGLSTPEPPASLPKLKQTGRLNGDGTNGRNKP